jgi:hypothetical protein
MKDTVCIWLILYTHPLYPPAFAEAPARRTRLWQAGLRAGRPLKQVYLYWSVFIIFERGREFERGLCPLSPELPSPAINICGLLPVLLAGEGIKG